MSHRFNLFKDNNVMNITAPQKFYIRLLGCRYIFERIILFLYACSLPHTLLVVQCRQILDTLQIEF